LASTLSLQEKWLLDALLNLFGCEALDRFFSALTHLGDFGFIWIALACAMCLSPKARIYGLCCLIALGIYSIVFDFGLKNLIMRPRPFESFGQAILISHPGGFSFPSGHTGCSGIGAFYIIKARRAWAAPVLCLAFLIAFSRLYLYVHYPSDVLFGAIFGFATAYGVWEACTHLRARRQLPHK